MYSRVMIHHASKFLMRASTFSRRAKIRPVITENRHFSGYPVSLSYSYFNSDKQRQQPNPLIILHGLLGSKLNWRSLGKVFALKTGKEVYTLDARNHGDSPHCEEFDYNLMSHDVLHFMQEKNISSTILLGHSMGGRTAMTLALTEPKMIEKLIIVDVSPSAMPKSSSGISSYMSIMQKSLKLLPMGITLPQARKFIDEYMEKFISEKGIRQFLLTNLTERDGSFLWKANLNILERKFETTISAFPFTSGSYEGETLFICGGTSPYVSTDDHPHIKSLFPKAQFVYIPEAGHWVHSEKPAEFLKVVESFIT